MWAINALDVIHLGRTSGGDHFTEFVNSLIYSLAYSTGVSSSEIHTNLRVNKQDGGVDTEISKPIQEYSLGWTCNYSTIWQYKATGISSISKSDIIEEVTKWYAADCIKRGYGFRLCICDSDPSGKKKSLEKILNEEIKKINNSSPDAIILTADDLARWACNYPSISLRFFRPGVATLGQHFDAWEMSAVEVTPKYVQSPIAKEISEKICKHIKFSNNPPDIVLPISGLSGVGKTRLVYESVASCENARLLTIYTDDERNVLSIANAISNDAMLNAIIIADECGVSTRVRLNELLKGHRKRIRVVAIDPSGETPASYSPEIWLKKMPKEVTDEILAINYPSIPIGRRRAYVDLSGGFVRFAADLCRNDSMIASAGCVDPALKGIQDYLKRRFTKEELDVIQALSLVTKIGFNEDIAQELSELCKISGIDQQRFKEIANRIHDSSGLIARTHRYYYVTPEIIAQIGFDMGWNHWAKDAQEFLERMPKILFETFLVRVKKSASDDIKGKVGESFRRWSIELNSLQLNSVETVDRLITLIELEPKTYLHILRSLLEQATIEELRGLTGENIGGSYGPRRSIIWLAERIVAFPEYFDDAENILLRLGIAESEKNLGNNATAIWRQLYRIFLSGTAISFFDRLSLLERRILSDDKEISLFAIGALDGIFDDHASRMAGPSIVAGKIPPEEYVPINDDEYSECISQAIKLLRRIIDHDSIPEDARERAKCILADNTRTLLNHGFSDELQGTFSEAKIDNNLRIKLIENIETFLHFDIKAKWGRPSLPTDYIDKVNMWLATLKPSDIKGKISILVGTYRGHYSILGNDDKFESEIESLAKEFLEHPESLKQELDIFFSPDVKNASSFGYGLGKLDENAIFLKLIIDSSIQYNSTEFGRGYIGGILESYPNHASLVNPKLDEIQMEYPVLAYELFMTRIESTNALERALELVDLGKLGPVYLIRFNYAKGDHQLSQNDFEKLLQRLMNAAIKGDAPSLQAALEFISFRIFAEKEGEIEQILDHNNIRSLAWTLVEITPKKAKSYQWTQIIEALSKYDPDHAAKMLALGLAEGELFQLTYFATFFVALAKKHPELVMQRVGEVMLDKRNEWKFHVYRYSLFFKAIPDEVLIKWAKNHGIDGARLLARHLPSPYISDTGGAIVPSITQFILDNYADDDRVFNEFVSGVHSLKVYSGDIASQHDREAEIAQKFLNHPSEKIRKWAQLEEEMAISEAKRWRQFEEERQLD